MSVPKSDLNPNAAQVKKAIESYYKLQENGEITRFSNSRIKSGNNDKTNKSFTNVQTPPAIPAKKLIKERSPNRISIARIPYKSKSEGSSPEKTNDVAQQKLDSGKTEKTRDRSSSDAMLWATRYSHESEKVKFSAKDKVPTVHVSNKKEDDRRGTWDVSAIFFNNYQDISELVKEFIKVLEKNPDSLEVIIDGLSYLYAVIEGNQEKKEKSSEQYEKAFHEMIVTLSTWDKSIPLLCSFYLKSSEKLREKMLKGIYERHLSKNSLLQVLPHMIKSEIQLEKQKNSLFRDVSLASALLEKYALKLWHKELEGLAKFLDSSIHPKKLALDTEEGKKALISLATSFVTKICTLDQKPVKELVLIQKNTIEISNFEDKNQIIYVATANLLFLRCINFFLNEFKSFKEDVKKQLIVGKLTQIVQKLANRQEFEPVANNAFLNDVIRGNKETFQKYIDKFLSA